MKIMVDQEGRKAVVGLCDIALKQGGIQNHQAVGVILQSVEDILIDEPEKETEQ
jgi:hypothetical protein